jgi:hypothetical protein
MPRTRLKVGGSKFNAFLTDAIEANRDAALAVQAMLQAYEADALTTEALLAHLLTVSTHINGVQANLHQLNLIVRANA